MSTVVADPMISTTYRVTHVRLETSDTFTLELEATGGEGVREFRPGQFNMLYLFGVGEVPISISGNPVRASALVHTTREVGSVTRSMRQLRPGDCIGVRGPFGTHWPTETSAGDDLVLVAGGIGLAPLRSLLYNALDNRDRYGKVVLLYGTRTPDDILFRREIEKWRSHFDLEVYVTVDRATGHWHGNVGVVTSLIGRAPFDPLNTTACMCGPEVMMRFTVLELQRRGVPKDRIYLSMERNMKCGIGLCGHCQFGPFFVCRDGPVFRYSDIESYFGRQEV